MVCKVDNWKKLINRYAKKKKYQNACKIAIIFWTGYSYLGNIPKDTEQRKELLRPFLISLSKQYLDFIVSLSLSDNQNL